MVILGLGSNVGDRLVYLQKAVARLCKLSQFTIERVSALYHSDALVSINAPATAPYLNLALRCETSRLPQDLLQQIKQIELAIGRDNSDTSCVIDIDILAWDDLIDEELHIPHADLQRPYALWPLSDVAPEWVSPVANGEKKTALQLSTHWGSRCSGEAPYSTRQIHSDSGWIEHFLHL